MLQKWEADNEIFRPNSGGKKYCTTDFSKTHFLGVLSF